MPFQCEHPQEKSEDGPVAKRDDAFSLRKPHELPGSGRGEGPGFVNRVLRRPPYELSVGRIWHYDGKPHLGGNRL